MKVQLVYFAGCPNVDAARAALDRALAGIRDATVEEIDTSLPGAPEHLRAWGSPTILVDGTDVAGGAPEGVSCRLYVSGSVRGAPNEQQIRAAISRARRRR